MNTASFVRTTGLLASIGALMGISVNLVKLSISNAVAPPFNIIQILGAVAFGLILIGLFGLRRSGAIGDHSVGHVGIGLAIIGQTLTIPYELFQPHFLYPSLGIAAGLMIGIGMLLVGVAVIQTNEWCTWRKYTPLVYGLYPLVLVFIYPILEILPIFVNGIDQILTIIAFVCWLLLGIALWVESGSNTAQPDQTESQFI